MALLCLVFFAVLIRTAWISDDALITLRTVLNVTHGYGLTYNVAERVQTFTHPLWMAMLTATYTAIGNVYYATFALSLATSVAVFWLAVKRASSATRAALVAVVLLFSRAFIDFSTSGLENPLSHVLIAAFVIRAIANRESGVGLRGLWTLTSLLYLTRPDDVLVVAPALLLATWRAPTWSARARAAAIGLAPAAAWTLFALAYFGFPFPNTAYAKLATGISARETWLQGGLYLVDSFDRDPLTMLTIGLGVIAGVASRGLSRAVAIGIVIDLLYVVSVGGDFMSGRFMTVPLFAATLILGWRLTPALDPARGWNAARPVVVGAATLVLAIAGSRTPNIPLFSDSRFDDRGVRPSGITNERGFYFSERSLVHAKRSTFAEPAWPRGAALPAAFEVSETCGLMGVSGIDSGALVHLLDTCALADPLLARLPAVYNNEWRIGHFRRMIPDGYRDSLERRENRLTDPALHRYYDDLRLAIASPSMWTAARWTAIWRLNTGGSDAGIDRRFYRHAGSITELDRLATPMADGTAIDAPGVRQLTLPLAIVCDARPGRRAFDISLDSNDRYEVLFLRGRDIVGRMELGPVPAHRRKPGLTSYNMDVPPDALADGFDTIIVSPMDGDDRFAIGHLLLDGVAATQAELDRRREIRERLDSGR